jgi:hypothetical protein
MAKKQSNTGSTGDKTNLPSSAGSVPINAIPTPKEVEGSIQHGGMVAELLIRCGGVITSVIKPPPGNNNH